MENWMSEEIGELAGALVKAQAALTPAMKDRENPHFRSKYADLPAVWEAMGDALASNGLALTQLPFPSPEGVRIKTVLLHTSGQWLASDLEIRLAEADRNNPQRLGGAITYGRRYAACAVVGVVQDDDDGETASGRGPGHNYANGHRDAPAPSRPAKAPAPAVADRQPTKEAESRPFHQFVSDAAKAAGVEGSKLIGDIVDDLVYEEKIPNKLRDDKQRFDDAAHAYQHDRAYVVKVVKGLVKHYSTPAPQA